jgi:hypothetical protein
VNPDRLPAELCRNTLKGAVLQIPGKTHERKNTFTFLSGRERFGRTGTKKPVLRKTPQDRTGLEPGSLNWSKVLFFTTSEIADQVLEK